MVPCTSYERKTAGVTTLSCTNVTLFLLLWLAKYGSALSDLRLRQLRQSTSFLSVPLLHHSWMEYDATKNSQQQVFRRNGGILYKTSVFQQDELSVIKSEVAKLKLQDETSSSVARNRMGAILARESETVRILREGSLIEIVHKILGSSYQLSTDVPVELRVYETTGAGMEWHVDDILYDPSPQLEVVVTLENTSDCQTLWKVLSGESIEAIETQANSAIFLLAGGVPHCVTSLKRGRRAILKCAYVDASATFRSNEMVNQFGAQKSKKNK
jgi:hypothetical protein